jgi:hypothetical protein
METMLSLVTETGHLATQHDETSARAQTQQRLLVGTELDANNGAGSWLSSRRDAGELTGARATAPGFLHIGEAMPGAIPGRATAICCTNRTI